MTPTTKEHNFEVKTVKFMRCFFFNQANKLTGKYIVMMTKERSTKFINSNAHGGVILMLGLGHIIHIHVVEMLNFFLFLSKGKRRGGLKFGIILMTYINVRHIDCYSIKGI